MGRSRRSKCPGDERLLGAFLLELDSASRERIAEHVAACPLCRKKQAVLAEIAEELRARAEALPGNLDPEEEAALRKMAGAEVRKLRGRKPSRPVPGIVPFRAAAAAAVLVTAAAAGIFFYSRPGRQDVDRGARSGLRLVEPAGTLDRVPAVFRWTAAKNADFYRFEIFDEELRSIVVRFVKSTSLSLAPEELAVLRPGQPYYWDVEASDDEARPIASGQRSFVVAPDGAAKAPSAPIRTNQAQRRGCP
ncbi:MAG TPA: zf-HC2 domain-containing protein [Acidobacteriota bacterium]|nr:zf-HC2 domain-containing protein [Acidobacteriota bacterium]